MDSFGSAFLPGEFCGLHDSNPEANGGLSLCPFNQDFWQDEVGCCGEFHWFYLFIRCLSSCLGFFFSCYWSLNALVRCEPNVFGIADLM